MGSNTENALAIFKRNEGSEEGVSDWHLIDQKQIDLFAEATLDRQFIHTDPEMAAKVSPYGKTVAHGYLTLSMIPYLSAGVRAQDPAAYEGFLMGVNYGLDRRCGCGRSCSRRSSRP
jgi:acyl dehydratase